MRPPVFRLFGLYRTVFFGYLVVAREVIAYGYSPEFRVGLWSHQDDFRSSREPDSAIPLAKQPGDLRGHSGLWYPFFRYSLRAPV